MGFDANVKKTAKLLNDAIYIIPRNQRQYVWTTENWSDLLADVVFSTQTGATHFIGSIVLQKGDEENGLETFCVIDGQQRMITITVFMLAIMMQLKQSQHLDDYEGMLKYVEATDKKNNKHMILDFDQYQSMERMLSTIKTESPDSLTRVSTNSFVGRCSLNPSLDKQIMECYKYYYSAIHAYYEEKKNVDYILKIKDSLLGMSYVHIEADSEEDSYTVFEILNARGTDLEDSELLKNYIMRYIQPERNRDKVKVSWQQMEELLGKQLSSFIKHYAVHYYATEKQELRQNPYRNIRQNCSREDVAEILSDIRLKANYYYKIINPLSDIEEWSCTETEKKVLSFFKTNRQEQVRPLILSLMHQRALDNMNEAQYNDVLEFLYRFIICYTVIGEERSNKIRDIIFKYAPLIEKNYSDAIMLNLKKELKEKIPNEQFFANAFLNIGYSTHTPIFSTNSKKKKVQIVLRLIEEFWGNTSRQFDFTIEHIIPDSHGEESARIGNLLPLESNLNQRCKNKALKEKIDIYKESSFLSVKRFLTIREKKPDFQIDERSKRLAALFYNEILKI